MFASYCIRYFVYVIFIKTLKELRGGNLRFSRQVAFTVDKGNRKYARRSERHELQQSSGTGATEIMHVSSANIINHQWTNNQKTTATSCELIARFPQIY